MQKNQDFTTIDLINHLFPGQIQFLMADVAVIVRKKEQSIRNAVSDGVFPIPSSKSGAHRTFDIRDVANFIDETRALAVIVNEAPPATKQKLGRPFKAVSIAKKAAAALAGGAK